MQYVIKIEGLEGRVIGLKTADVDTWLKSYDAEAYDGRGDAVVTKVKSEAMRFDSPGAAFELWRSSPKSRPLRDDGEPNRPLTAFSITVEPA